MTWGFLWQSKWFTFISWDDVLISCFVLMVASAIPLYASKTVRDIARPKKRQLSYL